MMLCGQSNTRFAYNVGVTDINCHRHQQPLPARDVAVRVIGALASSVSVRLVEAVVILQKRQHKLLPACRTTQLCVRDSS